ncbi:hypothetical protein A3A93_04625 [Candidatus Roizmanbacteria bacterium RIFCSPLOWO2_01_FULL_38_12]|uniref:Phosphomannomutase/phosphoglucomutase n=1 Tax=Candidatus Roizmanbacteria bacterium RIFCSPLOWO2_01_FULL_38_12 TaxID=1802061 RepID=A0A1F7IYM9_9BACT|nr:MAG: hypothetical protein A3A93_04625 [Candidatus Roizmanbacteria bacterium RIFCSPLOWO2_01_FULL_38_12]
MTNIDPTIFKAYDIRAIYPSGINEEVMTSIAKAIYTFVSKRAGKPDPSIVIGYDMRLSSPSLFLKAKDALVSSGAKVVDIGLSATPTMYFTVRKFSYDAGVQISASHNPKEYNGIKMVMRDGDALIKIGRDTGMDEIKRITIDESFGKTLSSGSVEIKKDVLGIEIDDALKTVNPGNIENLKVVADPANAMGVVVLKELFEKVKTNFSAINLQLDGTFPSHQPDPLQHKNLLPLQDLVKTKSADLGISTDGDADRVMFVNEISQIIPATYITALIAGEVLRDNPHEKILVDIRYTRNVEHIVAKMGGKVGHTKVGHALITKQLNDEHALFAGESSGHYYFRSMGGCESSVRVILYVLRVLAREKKPISKILAEMETSAESGEYNFELSEDTDSNELLDRIVEQYSDGELSRLDGIAIDYPEWRFSIRSSNTEPLLRLNVEGNTKDIVSEKLQLLKDTILESGATLKE